MSLRPSNSSPSLKGTRNRPVSIHSTGSRGLNRHGLLKSDTTTDQPIMDEPIPPILTLGPLEPTGRNISMRHRFSSISIPIRESSKADLTSRTQGTPAADETRRPGVVCLDPTIHPPGTHAEIHHPGLVVGADFCDAGLAVERDSPIRTPPGKLSLVGPPNTRLTGRTRRVLSGGDVCEDIVDVSAHIHKNHSSAVKVRPATGLLVSNEIHNGHPGISKVQPASGEAGQKIIIHRSNTPIHAETTPKPYVLEHPHHGHSLAGKVRPSSDHTSIQGSEQDMPRSNVHEGHIWVPKVQPYHELSSVSFKTEENSIPRLAAEEQAQSEEHPSKAASYWGFLPIFGSKGDETADVVDELVGHSTTRDDLEPRFPSICRPRDKSVSISYADNRPSLSASQYSASQKSFDVTRKTAAKPTKSIDDQQNVHHDNGSAISFGKPFSANFLQEMFATRENDGEREIPTSSVSPTSYPHLVKNDRGKVEESTLTEKIDPRRATTWLRQFLGYPEPSNPSLTKLPDKSHPRHEDHDDYPNDEVKAMTSRVTTFSGQTIEDAGAMDTAMHKLERLLSEALLLANDVSKHDHCGFSEDGNPRSSWREADQVSHSPFGVVEDFKVSSGEPPNVFVGTIGDLITSSEVSPAKSGKRHREIRPDIYSGNITRSSHFEGRSKVRGLRKRKRTASRGIPRHSPDDECVLPMPLSDNQPRRHYSSPVPQEYNKDNPLEVIELHTKDVPNGEEVREYIRAFHQPPITSRDSSKNLHEVSVEAEVQLRCRNNTFPQNSHKDVDVCSLNDGTSDDVIDFSTQYNNGEEQGKEGLAVGVSARNNADVPTATIDASQKAAPPKRIHELRNVNLRRRSHVSIRDGQRFSLTKSVKRQPIIARDWSPIRKRFVASVACISTALIGVLVGIYAGLVPSIQYYIADFHHYSIIGNVGLYLGMALTTFFCWPLPLLHGRKPYIVCSLCVAMPLLFPQAIAVSVPRSPYTSVWRWALLFPRAIIGCALGFASMNFHSILTDLFGASLMSSNPHQEVVDHSDVRRHGGGLGVWLGIWTWCFIGSLGVGFLIGAVVIDTLHPSWGLYISIILIAAVLLLNVLCPEVRRSAWRRSVAEVRTGSRVSRRVARGEIMMHRVKDGPRWWGQEMYHGVALSLEMLRQPGFVVMAAYSAWLYAQVVLIIVLLGALSSRHYHYRSPYVGAAVSSVAIGALAAVPFQKANIFSRSRSTGPLTNDMTFDKTMTWTSHLVRRAIFIIVLPIAGILYTIVSSGPPVHLGFPCIFAAMIGFLTCLAIAECNGILMEAWDCSDFQPGMTGRSRSGKDGVKRTNYSSFPRVTAGWNIIHSIGFILAAGATGVGGAVTRSLGQRAATGVVASALFIHSLLLLAVLARFWRVQIIPNSKSFEMERWTEERRDSLRRRASAIAAARANGLGDSFEIPEEDLG